MLKNINNYFEILLNLKFKIFLIKSNNDLCLQIIGRSQRKICSRILDSLYVYYLIVVVLMIVMFNFLTLMLMLKI